MWNFPPVKVIDLPPETIGYNGQNDVFQVRIAKDVQQGFSWIGVLAEEFFECRYSWKCLLIPRLLETWLWGAVEAKANEVNALCGNIYDGLDLAAYEQGLAENILKGYSYLYSGKTDKDVLAMMQAYRSEAQAWIDANKPLLDYWYNQKKTGNV